VHAWRRRRRRRCDVGPTRWRRPWCPDDHNYERGVEGARMVAKAALAEFGAAGLAAMTVELSLQLASALEQIAA
jgi:hypothetical protein